MNTGSTGADEQPRDDAAHGAEANTGLAQADAALKAQAATSATDTTPLPGELEATLAHLGRLCGRLEQAETRFKQLTDECEGVLKGLVAVDRRHSSVIAGLNDRLGDWCHLESKLLEASARRIEQFERGVGHEWMVLRQMHEEPLAQLKDEADQLRMACLDAARMARFRFDSVEKAYTAYAAELDHRLTEWSRELLGAVKSARSNGDGPPSLSDGSQALALAPSTSVQPWPLEGVAQLHHELRAGGAGLPASTPALPRQDANASPAEAAPSSGFLTPASTRRARWRLALRGAAIGIAAIVVIAIAAYAIVSNSGKRASATGGSGAIPGSVQPRDATGPAPAAKDSAAGQPGVDAGRDRLAEAERAAERAGVMVDILAAADLRRYALSGPSPTAPNQPYGQLLWSRSRGLAASVSRLPAAPDGKVYRLWIASDGPPIAAGMLSPDAAGRATLLFAGPLKLPLPLTIRVTLEDRSEVTAPRGPVLLVRVPTQ